MPEISLVGVAVVAAVAFCIPLALAFLPRLRLPAVVLEIAAGIAIGPAALGWVQVDVSLEVLSALGLAFLLFLAGLEIDTQRLRGPLLQRTALSYVVSFVIALAVATALAATGIIDHPLLVAIILSSTALGIIIPLLKDAGHSGSTLGQLTVGGASLADFGGVILLSLLFSRSASSVGATLVLLIGLLLLVAAVAVALSRAGRIRALSRVLLQLQDSSSQIRVRGAFLLLAGLVWSAQVLGLEVILGAFLAGVVLRAVDRDRLMTHPEFRVKLDAVGFGVFTPFFFVVSGMRLDVGSLLDSPAGLLQVPVFLAGLLVARGAAALVYRGLLSRRETVVAGLLQATSLPFIVAAAEIGVELGQLTPMTRTAIVTAGLASVVLLPAAALRVLQGLPSPDSAHATGDALDVARLAP
jgi:Kef-type K+ transport system membrane component KefB